MSSILMFFYRLHWSKTCMQLDKRFSAWVRRTYLIETNTKHLIVAESLSHLVIRQDILADLWVEKHKPSEFENLWKKAFLNSQMHVKNLMMTSFQTVLYLKFLFLALFMARPFTSVDSFTVFITFCSYARISV